MFFYILVEYLWSNVKHLLLKVAIQIYTIYYNKLKLRNYAFYVFRGNVRPLNTKKRIHVVKPDYFPNSPLT